MNATPRFAKPRNMASNPLVLAIHTSVQGRVRLKIRGLQRSPRLQHAIEWELQRENGIVRTRASLLTGNVLVTFNPKRLDIHTITRRLEEIALAHSAPHPHRVIHHSQRVSRQPRWEWGTMDVSRDRFCNAPPLAGEASSRHWHASDAADILKTFDTSASEGLSSVAASDALQRYGPNRLAIAPPRSRLSIFIDYFKSIPVAVLAGAAMLSAATGGVADAVVIMGVVVINAMLGYATESHSDRVIRSLQSFVQPSALVVRDGILQDVPAAEVTVGDVLVLRPGCYVAADARLIETHRLTIDESALTGESVVARKTDGSLSEWNVSLADRHNMAYVGTLVTSGEGRGVVVAIGAATEIGRIQALVGEASVPETPMERQLERAGSQWVGILSVVCSGIFGLGLLRGYSWLQMLKTSISLAVAAV
ncbi:MAG: cation-transporting P-type ATPase, partial [Cyanobacteria bacterium J06639_1]